MIEYQCSDIRGSILIMDYEAADVPYERVVRWNALPV